MAYVRIGDYPRAAEMLKQTQTLVCKDEIIFALTQTYAPLIIGDDLMKTLQTLKWDVSLNRLIELVKIRQDRVRKISSNRQYLEYLHHFFTSAHSGGIFATSIRNPHNTLWTDCARYFYALLPPVVFSVAVIALQKHLCAAYRHQGK